MVQTAIDFVVFIGESKNHNANKNIPISITIAKTQSTDITFDPLLSTLNERDVFNEDWTYDGSNEFFHLFTYIGNRGVFPGNSTSYIGIKANFNTTSFSQGSFPLKTTIRLGSGGETEVGNNVDIDYIAFKGGIHSQP